MISEQEWIWLAAAGATVLIVGTYLLLTWRRSRADKARLSEARDLGIDKPRGQYPYIDPTICIGCGGCVKACPEGDVLGLVGGLATVVQGARCIGIGQCKKACPVDAIDLRVGSIVGRADMPVLDPARMTTVPGVYIVGELGGLALIRNAVEQGREAVYGIADRLSGSSTESSPESPNEAVDLLIIGCGPSGMSAALAAIERGLSYVVLEQQADLGGTIFQYPRQKLTHTQPVVLPLHGLMSRDEYSKEELLELFGRLAREHQMNIRFGQRVVSLEQAADSDHLTVQAASGTSFVARHVVLALGRRGTPRKLGVPGEDQAKVLYQVRDAEQYREQKILCVGGGDSAIEAAMGLARQPGNEVTLSYRKEQFFRIKEKNRQRLDKMLASGRLKAVMSSQVVEILADKVALSTADGQIELANEQVFVLIGGIPPFRLLKEAGVKFGDELVEPEAPEAPEVLGGVPGTSSTAETQRDRGSDERRVA